MSRMNFKFSLDTSRIMNQVTQVIDDPYVRRDIHRLLAKMCEKYVPYDTGKLSDRGTYYDKNGVHYGVGIPYAHYVYEGIVYGPNIPYIDKKTGEQKWYSPKGQKKVSTGRTMTYKISAHPLATSHWDKVMLQNEGDEFRTRAEAIVRRRLKKLNG